MREDTVDGWFDLHYCCWHDIARLILATGPDGSFMFWSWFDEELDDYIDRYDVWRIPRPTVEQLAGGWAAWTGELFRSALEQCPAVPLDGLPFDFHRLKAIGHDPCF